MVVAVGLQPNVDLAKSSLFCIKLIKRCDELRSMQFAFSSLQLNAGHQVVAVGLQPNVDLAKSSLFCIDLIKRFDELRLCNLPFFHCS